MQQQAADARQVQQVLREMEKRETLRQQQEAQDARDKKRAEERAAAEAKRMAKAQVVQQFKVEVPNGLAKSRLRVPPESFATPFAHYAKYHRVTRHQALKVTSAESHIHRAGENFQRFIKAVSEYADGPTRRFT